MNKQLLGAYITAYKNSFDVISQQELYKWKAVKCFQDNWDITEPDFSAMLNRSIRLTRNLLKSGSYFPLRMLQHYAAERPEHMRMLFTELFNEENDIYDRIKSFQNGTNAINNELFPDKNTYQDPRAVIVYLAMRYPQRYYLFKYEMFREAAIVLENIYRPMKGYIENIGQFFSFCDIIRHEISKDQELIQLHKNRVTEECYFDENFLILTQDLVYAITRHLQVEPILANRASIVVSETIVTTDDLNNTQNPPNFKGRFVNFLQNGIENKRIGDLGELWVMNHEANKLRRAGLQHKIKQIKHTAKDEGDGTGYDIKSFDEKGRPIFIEVKTTKGTKESTIYITANELQRSKIEASRYFLYRVFNFKEENNSAELFIINGDLTPLCNAPAIYSVNINQKKCQQDV